nr:hypothetical protein HK105_001126 [Polyrhizophydium stewartii]
MAALFEQRETEENWTKFDEALMRLTAITRGSAHLPGFVSVIKTRLKSAIVSCLSTERTRLARTAMTLVEELGRTLRERFDPLADVLLPPVLKLTTRANKVFVASASLTIKTCISSCGLSSFAPALAEGLKNPSKTMRIASMECLSLLIECNPAERLVNYMDAIETTLRDGIVDSFSEVRDIARSMFEIYRPKFPDRADRFVDGLPETARKYLKLDKSKQIRTIAKIKAAVRAPSREFGLSAAAAAAAEEPSFTGSTSDLGRYDAQALGTGGSSSASAPLSMSLPASFTLGSKFAAPAAPPLPPAPAAPPVLGAPRRTLGEPARIAAPQQPEPPRVGQNRMTFLTEHLGGAQRVVRPEKQAPAAPPAADPAIKAKFKPMRVPVNQGAPLSGLSSGLASGASRPASLVAEGGRPASQTGMHALMPKASSDNLARGIEPGMLRRPNTTTVPAPIPPMAVSSTAALGGSIKRTDSAASSRSHESPSSDTQLDLVKLKTDMKSADWAQRAGAMQTILSYMSHLRELDTEIVDFRSKMGAKLFEIIMLGVMDAHFRVVHLALQTAIYVVETPDLPQSVLEQTVPKVSSIYYSPNQKNKHGVGEAAKDVLLLLRARFTGDMLCDTVTQALHNPEFSMNLKMRAGCIGFLTELSQTHWEAYLSRPGCCKLLVSRLMPLLLETDPFVQRSLRSVLQTICATLPEAFWPAFAALKPTDKKQVSALFGKDIEFDKNAFVAACRASISPQPASPTSPQRMTPRALSLVQPKISARKPVTQTSPSRPGMFKTAEELMAEGHGEMGTDGETEDEESLASSRRESALSGSDINYGSEISSDGQVRQAWLHAENIESFSGMTMVHKLRLDGDSVDRQTTPTPRKDGQQQQEQQQQQQLPPRMRTQARYSSPTPSSPSPTTQTLHTVHMQQPTPEAEEAFLASGFNIAPDPSEETTESELQLADPTTLRHILFSDDDQPAELLMLMQQDQMLAASRLEAVVRASRKRRPSLWEANAAGILQVVLGSLTDVERTATSIKNSLVVLRELVANQTEFVLEQTTAVMLSVLQCETDADRSAEELLEIAFEVDAVLATIERHVPHEQLLKSVLVALDKDIGRSVCFGIMARLVAAHGDDIVGIEDDEDGSGEERFLEHLARGVDSQKSAARKAAFDCAYALRVRRGAEWGDRLYSAVRKAAGVPRESVIRGMMEKRLEHGIGA